MSRAARRSRALAGVAFLAVAGALGSRRLPGRIALWPASFVPTWFGISHLLAGVTGYQGCPELGAIPTVMLGRPVGSSCELWRRIDGWVEPTHPKATRVAER
jgi:disulfide bond formation protein DsbB